MLREALVISRITCKCTVLLCTNNDETQEPLIVRCYTISLGELRGASGREGISGLPFDLKFSHKTPIVEPIGV